MKATDLFAALGVAPDKETFDAAHRALDALDKHKKETAARAHLAVAIERVTGDTGKAMDLIGLGDGAAKAKAAMDEQAGGTTKWGAAVVVLNQGLALAQKLYGGLASGVARVRGLAEATGAQAAQAVELSMRLGITAESVQELGYAANLSGSSVEGMADGLRMLSNQVDTASRGGKEAAKALRDVGISAKDVKSGKLPLDAALGDIAEKFKALPDGAKKSALAVDLFGKSGGRLIPLLNEGKAGIAALRQEARDLGYVIDNDTAVALEGFGDETDKVKAQLDGLRNQAIAAVLPQLTELVQGVQEWIQANRDLLIGALTTALRGFIVAMQAAASVVQYLTDLVRFYGEHLNIVIPILELLGVVMVAFGAKAAAAWLMALGPVALVAIAVAALVLFMPFIAKAVESAARAIARALGWVADKFMGLLRGIRDVAYAVGGFFADIAGSIRDAFGAVFDWIDGLIVKAIRAVDVVIDGLNHLPFVDIPHLLGDGEPPTARARGANDAGSTNNVSNQVAITIDARGADGEEVGRHVERALDRHLRTAADGIG